MLRWRAFSQLGSSWLESDWTVVVRERSRHADFAVRMTVFQLRAYPAGKQRLPIA